MSVYISVYVHICIFCHKPLTQTPYINQLLCLAVIVLNPLQECKTLDLSKLKAYPLNKINTAQCSQ